MTLCSSSNSPSTRRYTITTRFITTFPTAGAVIRYTVTGAESTLFDPIVITGQTVQVGQNMTLKAKASSGAVTSTTATLTDYLTGCTKVAAGLEFSAALEASGLVSTWGNQANGLLANGSLAAGSRKFAGLVKTTATTDLTGIRDIALGKDFALAREACSLKSASALGRVWVWGNKPLSQNKFAI